MAMIELEDITKRYQKGGAPVVHALRGVSLAIGRGELVAIAGASGSGKSTLMNVLGLLDRPDGGRYRLDGREVSTLSAREQAALRNARIGFVFQAFHLLPRTSALENVELPMLYRRGVGARERRDRAAAALESVGLGERLDHHPNQLSGGQQQRVAIARALVNRPALLLADEPTGNLDTRTSVEVMQIFQHLNDDGLTIVLVTHEPDIAEYASRVVAFRDGRVRGDRPVVTRRRADDERKTLEARADEDALIVA